MLMPDSSRLPLERYCVYALPMTFAADFAAAGWANHSLSMTVSPVSRSVRWSRMDVGWPQVGLRLP
jgi:hypothetical protein